MARRQRRIDPKDFWVWKSHRVSWCVRCHRTIERGDVVRFEEFYDEEGRYEAVTHNDCRDVHDRARLPAPEPVFVWVGGEVRRMVMDVKITTTEEQQEQQEQQRKSSTKKSAKGTRAKEVSSKKSSKSDDSKASRKPMVVTVAERLAPHFKGKNVPVALKLMAKGETPANSELIELREAVKALAKKYREEGLKGEASALSATNVLVRRLERATR